MSRMSSTPLFDAASSSVTSSDVPLVIATQLAQTLHASPSRGFSQLSALARIRAVVVLPVPRGPEKRYACETRWFFTAPWRARTTWS